MTYRYSFCFSAFDNTRGSFTGVTWVDTLHRCLLEERGVDVGTELFLVVLADVDGVRGRLGRIGTEPVLRLEED